MAMSSTVINIQEPPEKEKPSTSMQSLPDDLVVSCLACVSRLHYPILSLVSKRFRSLLASPELYQSRSLLARTKSCIYLCLRFLEEPNPRFFTLCRKPDKTLTNKKMKKKGSSGYVLASIPISNSPPVEWSNLYAVCESAEDDDAPCSNVSYLNCRSHTWLEAPSLRFAHPSNKLDGKLYFGYD